LKNNKCGRKRWNKGKIVTGQIKPGLLKGGGINTMRQENQLIFFSHRAGQDNLKNNPFPYSSSSNHFCMSLPLLFLKILTK
jgi:hypothetical protein